MLNSPKILAAILGLSIAVVVTAFISFLPNADFFTLFVAFISSFFFGGMLIFFAMDYLVFKEVNKLYDNIKKIKKKNFNVLPRKQLIEKENPIALLRTELDAYVSTKEDEVKELKKAAKYRQEFLADVSHELKTPIFAAQGFVHTLLDNPEEDASIRQKFLEKAAKSLDGLDELVQDLLVVSQLETGAIKVERQPLDLRALVLEVFEQLESKAKRKGVQLRLDGPAGPIMVRADAQRMTQVMSNLIDNAIKYGNEHGLVEVLISEKNKTFLVDVRDNGPGIAAEHLPRLFERFYRVDKSRAKLSGGSGLGLSIVKHILQAHGSKIQVHSKLEKGTVFSFKLEKGN